MNQICIAIFVYNRSGHTDLLFKSLVNCRNIEQFNIVVFVDGPKNEEDEVEVKKVVNVLRTYQEYMQFDVKAKSRNIGLANSIIEGVSFIFEHFDKVIVLEDDLILHGQFLEFMQKTLNYYETMQNIFAVSGYLPPLSTQPEEMFHTNLFPRIHSWGWGTWRNRWNEVDWTFKPAIEFIQDSEWVRFFLSGGPDLLPMLIDQIHGRNQSWAIRFNLAASRQSSYTVYPSQTLVVNRGFDGTGVHCGFNDVLQHQQFDSITLKIDPKNFRILPEKPLIDNFRTNYE